MNTLEFLEVQQDNFLRLMCVSSISNDDLRIIHTLYTPIIGSQAATLYTYCAQQSDILSNDHISHTVLLRQLQIDLQQFVQAKKRLEGIGLWESYRLKTDSQLDWVYQLKAPLSASEFLADPILCGLLVDTIGQVSYDKLVKQFMSSVMDLSQYEKMTQTFYQVYGKQLGIYQQDTDMILSKVRGEPNYQTNTTIDWLFLSQLLNQTYVTDVILTAQLREQIVAIMQLYTLTILELRDLLIEAFDVQNNEISIEKLYRLARQKGSSTPVVIEKSSMRTNELSQQGYSEETAAFLLLCEQQKPSKFIEMIKEIKNQQLDTTQRLVVERSELQLLERFVVTQKVPMPVVNVLIHHMLVTENMPTLVDKYAIQTINDWIKHHVTTAQEAIERIKQRLTEQYQLKEKTPYKSQKRGVKRVEMSQREKDALHDVDTPLSEAEILELLKGL